LGETFRAFHEGGMERDNPAGSSRPEREVT